jgi:alpha/beta superfamily hydrolase
LMRADMTVRFHGEQIWIPSADNFRVDAMLIPPQAQASSNDAERRAVIICNPNGGLYEFHHLQMDWIQFYTSLGCHVLVYNYRGYGRNAGSPSPLDHNRDGLAIVHFLKTQRSMAKIAIHGESIGVSGNQY